MRFGQVEGTDIQILDPRFRRLFAGYVRVERLWTGAVWSEGPVWFPAGRYLVWSDIPSNRMLRWSEDFGPGFGVSRAVQQFQRQHHRQPGAARHLRAFDAAGDAHRDRRLDRRRRRPLAGQAAEFTQRRRGEVGRFGLVHRPVVRHRFGQRGRARRARNRRLPRLSGRSGQGGRAGDRRHAAAERPRLLARRAPSLRRRHRCDSTRRTVRATSGATRSQPTAAAFPAARCSPN